MLDVYKYMFDGRLHKMGTKARDKSQIDAVKKSAWAQFIKQFPNADKNQFFVQTNVGDKWNVTAELFFQRRPRGFTECVWFRQKILEPANEDPTRFDRRVGLPLSTVAAEKQKGIANSRN